MSEHDTVVSGEASPNTAFYVSYQVKYEGTYKVSGSKGTQVINEALEQMRVAKTKRPEIGIKQAPMVTLEITAEGIVVSSIDTFASDKIVSANVEDISYIARDPNNKRYLAIVHDSAHAGFQCTLIKHDVAKTQEIVLSLDQAFTQAYQDRIKEGRISTVSFKEQVDIYKSRLRQLSDLLDANQLKSFLTMMNISEITEIRGLKMPAKSVEQQKVNMKTDVDDYATISVKNSTGQPAVPQKSVTKEENIFDFGLVDAPPSSTPKVAAPTATVASSTSVPSVTSKPTVSVSGPSDDPFGMGSFANESAKLPVVARTTERQRSADLMNVGLGDPSSFEFDPLKM